MESAIQKERGKMTTKIYALCEPNGGEIRYIGKTIVELSKRLSRHLVAARCGEKTRKANWVRSLLSKGFFPGIILVGIVEGDGCLEEKAWIKYFRDEGLDLVNTTDGGEGTTGGTWKLSDDTRRKMSLAQKGKKRSDEARHKMSQSAKLRGVLRDTIEKMRLANFGKQRSADTCRKISLANTGRKCTKEQILRNSLSHIGKKLSEETKRKIGFIHRGSKRSDETRLKMKMAWKNRNPVSKETCRKISAALLGRKLSVEHKLKIGLFRTGKKRSEKEKHNMVLAWQKRKLKKGLCLN